MNYTVIASDKNWLESRAVDQLAYGAGLPDMVHAYGMPDLHPGKGIPIGASLISERRIYPFLIGNDIGCGMALWQLDKEVRKAKPEKWFKQLSSLESVPDEDPKPWMESFQVAPTGHDEKLGTIGGGNHFAELQKIEEVFDEDAFAGANLSTRSLFMLIHSGSRGYGEAILRRHVDAYKNEGVPYPSSAAGEYLEQHDNAVRWAKASRARIADRFMRQIGAAGKNVLNSPHNALSSFEEGGNTFWIHRKGASPGDEGIMVVPGSRGTLSYLVKPIDNARKGGFSIAHGAGRKWSRSSVKGKLENKYRKKDMIKTGLQSYVICEDNELLYQEAPEAYKNIDTVIDDLVQFGLVQKVASFRPLITYKTRR